MFMLDRSASDETGSAATGTKDTVPVATDTKDTGTEAIAGTKDTGTEAIADTKDTDTEENRYGHAEIKY
jgi:hypothetical protein